MLDLILAAMQDELNDSEYYKALSYEIPNPQDREVVYNVYLDELKHYKYLEEIYFKLTGRGAPRMAPKPPYLENRLYENFERSVYEETKAVNEYRKLYYAFLDPQIRDIFYEIITDEQRHAAIFSTLYSKYK